MFEEMIENYLARLKEIKIYDVKSVILFGSVARGQAKEHSDIDIIVVASGLPELKRRDVLPPFRKPARIQDIHYDKEYRLLAVMHGLKQHKAGSVESHQLSSVGFVFEFRLTEACGSKHTPSTRMGLSHQL